MVENVNVPETNEKDIQSKVIELLKKMGYNFIPRGEMESFPNYRLNYNDTLLRGILKEQLAKMNSFEYKGKTYKFSNQNLEEAIKRFKLRWWVSFYK